MCNYGALKRWMQLQNTTAPGNIAEEGTERFQKTVDNEFPVISCLLVMLQAITVKLFQHVVLTCIKQI